jgi:hypothetical protein
MLIHFIPRKEVKKTNKYEKCFNYKYKFILQLEYHTRIYAQTVIVSRGTCTVVSVNKSLVEDRMCRFKNKFVHFIFKKCPIYTHDGASAKFCTNSHETDNSACLVLLTV